MSTDFTAPSSRSLPAVGVAGTASPDAIGRSSSLDHKLTTLKLARIRQIYPSWVEHAAQTQLGYADFLDELVSEELLARQEHQLRRRMRQATFPYAVDLLT